MDSYGFSNTTIGQDPDKVSLIALCRGYVQLQTCHDCINNATRLILEVCLYKKSALVICDKCLLRYSNESFRGTVSIYPRLSYYNNTNFSNPQLFFNQYLTPFLTSLQTQASMGGKRKFAANVTSAPDNVTVHALVQCTADLSAESCINCLSSGYRSLPSCSCYGKLGLNFMMPSCNFRYETYSFFDKSSLVEAPPPLWSSPSPASSPSPPPASLRSLPPASLPQPPTGKDDETARTVIIIVVPTVTVVIFTVCIPVILMKRRKGKQPVNKRESIHGDDISTAKSLQYEFSIVRATTDNFLSANKLGQGGFGPVYKGKLPNGRKIVVKRLSADSRQGDLEFKNEVLLVARLQHRNLVRLLEFCLDRTERLLVYEFVPNASLDHFLFDQVKLRHLDWERRSKIIGGVAKGIVYLHEDSRLRIIHRNLKASNVLLDA